MKVFITGASGFIGSHVTRALVTAGHDVLALALPDDPLRRLRDVVDRINVITGTLSDAAAVGPRLAEWQPGVCVHLAWYAEPGKYLHAYENIQSLTDSLGLLRVLIHVKCGQVVMAGTCAEYDTDMGFLREEGPTRPATLYAASKLSCCLIGQQMAEAANINFAWARIFYPYGPCEDGRRMVPGLIRALLKGEPFPATAGEQVRDYLHVEDVADAFRVLVDRQANGVFNIASGLPLTVRQLMDAAGEIIGRSDLIQYGALPYRDWEPRFLCGDNRRLRGLGWQPHYTLRDGLRHTIKWWKEAEPNSEHPQNERTLHP